MSISVNLKVPGKGVKNILLLQKISKVSSAPADIVTIKVATPMPHTGVRKTPKKKVFQHGRKTTKGIVL